MESLNRLGDELPSELVAAAEKDLQQAFRGAALSLTGLFKVGKKATKKGEQSLSPLVIPLPSSAR